IIVAFFDGLLVGIGLAILGVPLAAALAVIVMFGALIPVIGAPIATLFAAVVALATEGVFIALLVVGLTVVVGSFDGDIMQPLIMGHAVQLHPLAIVSAIAFGTLTFGIVGALIAVPILGTVYSIAKYLSGRSLPPRLMPPHERRKPRWPKFMRKRHRSSAPTPANAA
ncbi:MAG: AI-2E family transporter, partial [Actinobacteria bacterium]|nr:AI-2E family transporter [Actinomycetota bacterium]